MKKQLITYILLLSACVALAQEPMNMNMPGMDMKKDTTHHHMMKMNSQLSTDLPMNRDGSGTSWVPDESPMYAYMIHGKNG